MWETILRVEGFFDKELSYSYTQTFSKDLLDFEFRRMEEKGSHLKNKLLNTETDRKVTDYYRYY